MSCKLCRCAVYGVTRCFLSISKAQTKKTIPQSMIRTCSICFEIKHIPNTKYYKCIHNEFCKLCVDQWRDRGNDCPICRAPAASLSRCWLFC